MSESLIHLTDGNGSSPKSALRQDTITGAQLQQVAEIRAASSELLRRAQFLKSYGLTFKGARDTYQVFGYPEAISTRAYRERYLRGGISGRIVDALPNATWRGTVEVLEDRDPHKNTKFEQAWLDLDSRLQVQARLLRVDKLSQLSNYAVLLIGASGNLYEELPKGKSQEGILYLSAYLGGGGPMTLSNVHRSVADDADATIYEYDTDSQSPRFGLPKIYQLRRSELLGSFNAGMQNLVHWTRVVHVADGCIFDDVFGLPALERIWNLLEDLEKVTGGGAEAFWLRANQGLHLDIDKDMSLPDATNAVAALKEQAEDYKHQLTRWLRTRGVSVDVLGSDVANFASPADVIMTQIAGAKGIPKRILTGSEMGELASSQDRDNWKDQINGRQTQYAGPYIVRPLVDRLIKYGYLPTPEGGPGIYEVVWPHIEVLTEAEKGQIAAQMAAVNNTYGDVVFTDAEIRDRAYKLEPLTDEEKEAARPAQPEPTPETPPIQPELATLEHKYASTEVRLPSDLALRFLEFPIAPDDLAEDGRETSPHVTVKYGLHTNHAADVIDVAFANGPVAFRLGSTAFFRTPEYDVVYVCVEDARDLIGLRRTLEQYLHHTQTQAEYIPHATLAYVKPGLGEKYAGRHDFEGETIVANELIFSPATGEPTVVPLLDPLERELFQTLNEAKARKDNDRVRAIIGLDLRELGGEGSGNFGHAGRPGEVGGSAPSGGGSGTETKSESYKKSRETFRALKREWSTTNTQLLKYVDHPDSTEARALLQKQKEITQAMQRLDIDPGGLEGIGLPGGPRDVVVIGAGPGGLSASIAGATEGLDTLVIDGNTEIGGQAKFSSRVENYPGYPIGTSGDDLAQDMFNQATRVGAEAKLGVRAVGLTNDPETGVKTITLSNGETIQTRAVVLGTGVEFRPMDFEGAQSPNVIYGDAKTCAEQAAGGSAVIIGGSNGASQAALTVAEKANEVYLLSRSPLEKSMSAYQRGQIENHPKIKTIIGDQIAAYDEASHTVSTINGRDLSANAVGVFIGSRPNLDWLPTEITKENGRIKTDINMETSIPGVFAVGDNRVGSVGRIITAAGDGQVAIRSAFDYFNRLQSGGG